MMEMISQVQSEPIFPEAIFLLATTYPDRETPAQATQVFYRLSQISVVCAHYPKESASVEDWARFKHLVRKWREERGSTSSIVRITNCESYRAIIGFGKKAIPMILQQLQQTPDFWFAALRALSDEDPVGEDARGNVKKMTDAWIRWGVLKGHIKLANGHRADAAC